MDIEKATTVYDRLRRAYNIDSDEILGKKLGGITKQAVGKRKKSGKWDPQEILDHFPDVNYDWVFSDSLHELRRLPVLSDSVNEPEPEYADSIVYDKNKSSDPEIKVILEQIEFLIERLKDKI